MTNIYITHSYNLIHIHVHNIQFIFRCWSSEEFPAPICNKIKFWKSIYLMQFMSSLTNFLHQRPFQILHCLTNLQKLILLQNTPAILWPICPEFLDQRSRTWAQTKLFRASLPTTLQTFLATHFSVENFDVHQFMDTRGHFYCQT